MECPDCLLYKKENERLWNELDVLLKMVEQHEARVEEIIDEPTVHRHHNEGQQDDL